ncbi:hypothetical protein DB347_20705 [Opitutaceae bacterium EW11]|nr:hypothetical protein DB347_20705 [Opitutaceae bacterium EW11]
MRQAERLTGKTPVRRIGVWTVARVWFEWRTAGLPRDVEPSRWSLANSRSAPVRRTRRGVRRTGFVRSSWARVPAASRRMSCQN